MSGQLHSSAVVSARSLVSRQDGPQRLYGSVKIVLLLRGIEHGFLE